MRIDAGSHVYQSQPSLKASRPTASDSSAAEAPAANSLSGITQTDFTSMPRQQLSDWMNGQIRSGAMSLDESTPFLGMTLKVDVQTMQPVDMATDSTPVNFMDKARQGIAGALLRGDQDGAARLQAALDTMHRAQGQVTGVDIHA